LKHPAKAVNILAYERDQDIARDLTMGGSIVFVGALTEQERAEKLPEKPAQNNGGIE
jgi:hypothetical protein